LLSQLLYWWSVTDGKEFYKTDQELYNEIRINRKTLIRARKRLEEKDWIKVTIKGIPPKNYYIINSDKIKEDIKKYKQNQQKEQNDKEKTSITPNIPKKNIKVSQKETLNVSKRDNLELQEETNNTYITHKLHKNITVSTIPVNSNTSTSFKNTDIKQKEKNEDENLILSENKEILKEPKQVNNSSSDKTKKVKPNKLSPAIGIWKQAYNELTKEPCTFTNIDGRFLKLILQQLNYNYDKWKQIVEYIKLKQKQGFSRFYPFSISFIYRNLSRLLLELNPPKKDYTEWLK